MNCTHDYGVMRCGCIPECENFIKNKKNYSDIGKEIGAITDEKQAAYGDSFGKSGAIMKILYPNGIALDQYNDALSIVRIIDKLFRIATKKDAFGESPYKDIAGYALLGAGRHEEERKNVN